MVKNKELLQEKIEKYLDRLVTGGSLKVGDRLHTEREMAKMFDASIRPVRIAVDRFIDKGILVREHGRGTFVKKLPRQAQKLTNTIGVIHTFSERGFFASSFYTSIFDGIQGELDRQDKKMVFRTLVPESGEDAGDLVEALTGEVDGFLHIDAGRTRMERSYPALKASGKPVVMVNSEERVEGFSSVCADSRRHLKELTGMLIGNGHRRIAFLHMTGDISTTPNVNMKNRLAGYRDALQEAGLAEDEALVRNIPVFPAERGDRAEYFTVTNTGSPRYRQFSKTYLSVKKVLQELMSLPAHPTAAVCPADGTAFPVLVMARELGLDVPGDLSVAGHDNLPETEMLNPSLTTVDGCMFRQGEEAVRLLLRKIQDHSGRDEHILLHGKIIKRSSHTSIV